LGEATLGLLRCSEAASSEAKGLAGFALGTARDAALLDVTEGPTSG